MGTNETEAQERTTKLEQALKQAEERIARLQKQVEQSRVEAASSPSATRFRALFEHALDAILIADDDGQYVDANPAATALLGVSREEVLGKTVADFGPPDLDFAAAWHNFLNSETEQGEFPIYRPDGTVRYAEYAAVPGFLPGRHLSILRDVTERHQAEEALSRSEAKYRTLFETMAQGVVYHDAQGNIVEANRAATRIFNRSREEIISLTAEMLPPVFDEAGNRLHPDQLPARVALRTGEAVHNVIMGVYQPDEDDFRWVKAHAIPQFREGQTEPYRVYTTFEDITERTRLLRDLQALAATLEKRVKLRTEALQQRSEQLSAVASALAVAEQRERSRISQVLHDDLQQLLHAAQIRMILLASELGGADEHVQEWVSELERLNEQALAVTRSLTVELNPPVLEDEGLAEAFRWLAGHMEGIYGLRVDVGAVEAEPAGADLRELVFQMVRELLFNVVKHAGVDEARLTVLRQDGRCQITVADDGGGFDPASLEEPGESVSGYGLHSIRERLELFSGTFQVETAPGKGTAVVLSLPCRSAERGNASRGGD